MRTSGIKTLFITGGAGFIGAHFTRLWRQYFPQDQLVVLDKLTYAGNLQNLASVAQQPHFHFYQGDICDQTLLAKIFSAYKPHLLVHFAAETHVDRSITDAASFIQTNVVGTQRLLEVALHYWRQQPELAFRFHHISTDEVFGSLKADEAPSTENSPYCPNSPYSASKAAADHIVRAYRQTYGLPTTLSFCANNYGPQQYPEKLIPLAISRILEGKSIPIYGNGQNIRDWLYVEDHCEALIKILNHEGSTQSYNIGGYESCTNLTLIQRLCKVVDKFFQANKELKIYYPESPAANRKASRGLITFVTDRPGHDERYALDDRRLRLELDWAPSTHLEQGLLQTLQAYLDIHQLKTFPAPSQSRIIARR